MIYVLLHSQIKLLDLKVVVLYLTTLTENQMRCIAFVSRAEGPGTQLFPIKTDVKQPLIYSPSVASAIPLAPHSQLSTFNTFTPSLTSVSTKPTIPYLILPHLWRLIPEATLPPPCHKYFTPSSR